MSKRVREAELAKRRQLLKASFKRVVRGVIINSQWLDNENEEDTKISSNARRNIALLVRPKRRIGILTATEKSIIRKPHQIRTVADRKKLCLLFAGLKCFFWIPPKLRARLVPFIKFMTLGADQTIMREGDIPITVFFIVAGEVEMITRADDVKLSRKLDSKGEIIFGPGDCIGDVAMVEDCVRAHAFRTTSQCELLVLFDNDFVSILKPYMQKVWNEKKKALKAFDYFDFLNEDQILNACKLCSLKQFKPLDTIYSQDKGTLTNVHFVLSGECVILQCLNMKMHKKNGKEVYELVDATDESILRMTSESSSIKKVAQGTNSFDDTNKNRKELFSIVSIDTDQACAMFNRNQTSTLEPVSDHGFQKKMSQTEEGDEEYNYFLEEEFEDTRESNSSSVGPYEQIERKPIFATKQNVMLETHSTDSEIYSVSSTLSSSSRSSITSDTHESHFIDVGSLTFGGIFGLGEKIQQRVIMARSTVQCLLLPRFFLFDKDQNPGNIWRRRCFYLDCIIPSREALFDNFLKTLKWNKFKHDFIQQSLTSNANDIARDEDIPILCRIEEERKHF